MFYENIFLLMKDKIMNKKYKREGQVIYDEGSGFSKVWTIDINRNEVFHRDDGPAVIILFPNGKIKEEIYFIEGKKHRENGPAVIFYSESGIIIRQEYFIKGIAHNENGPAITTHFINGEINTESYIIYSKALFQAPHSQRNKSIIKLKKAIKNYKTIDMYK